MPLHTVVMSAAVAVALGGLTGAEPRVPLIRPDSLDAALTGWEKRGDAKFEVEPGGGPDGKPALRVTIAPGVELKWQQAARTLTDGVRPGDAFQASAFVRTEGVADGTGAYMAVEFLAEGENRAGIAHSAVSIGNGAKDWQRLTAEGVAPAGTRAVRLSLILNSHATARFAEPELARTGRQVPWPDLGSSVRAVKIRGDKPVQAAFAGVGFHAFQHSHPGITDDEMNEVVYKRWRELRPSFVRLNDEYDWKPDKWNDVVRHLRHMQATNTEMYLCSWNPPVVKNDAELRAWASKVADNLQYLVKTKGIKQVKWYCMSNELSLNGWGAMAQDLPTFKKYHVALHAEIAKRRLPVGLLATDASPVEYWHTLEWAAKNMDAVTEVYGGHHYFNNQPPDDERSYPWWLDKLKGAVAVAGSKGKQFILGEFGSKQDGATVNGVKMDRCIYYETSMEPMVGLQIAESAIAGMNAGVRALGYWTFMDFPDDYSTSYKNKWGLFRWSFGDRSTRAPYYGYGLMTRYFRGPATTFSVDCADPRLRVAALRSAAGKWSIAVVNRGSGAAPLRVSLPAGAAGQAFRKYVYDPARVKQNRFGDMPPYAAVVKAQAQALTDTVGSMSLTVYTTDYDAVPPAAPRALSVDPIGAGDIRLTWKPAPDADVCYYRVYRGPTPGFKPAPQYQIASTIGLGYVDPNVVFTAPMHYKVVAVDNSGNAGPAAEPK